MDAAIVAVEVADMPACASVSDEHVIPLVIAGAGLIGRRHLALAARSPRCRVVAVVDPDPRTRELADAHGARWCADLEGALDDEARERGERGDGGVGRVRGVMLATPNHLHLDGVVACVARGIATFVEKPVVDSLAALAQLQAAVATSAVPVLVGHHRRHGAALQHAREAVASGALGRVVAVTGAALFAKPDHYFTDAPWRTRAGGGPLLINLIHEVDALRYVVGEIDTVQAFTSAVVRGFEVEDTAAITMRFTGGALGTFVLSDAAAAPCNWEHTSRENPEYPHTEGADSFVVAGTQGTLAVPTLRTWRYDGPPDWWVAPSYVQAKEPIVDPLAAQFEHFLDVIEGRAEPRCSAADAGESLRVVEAVRLAAATGAAVRVADCH